MSYMDPHPEGLNTEKAPESIVETLKMSDNKTVTLMRMRDQWAKCDPEAMCHMSQAAIFHALNDAKHDVLAMHDAMLAAAPTPAAQSAGQEAVPELHIVEGERDGNWREFDVNGHGGFIRIVARMEGDAEDLPMSQLVSERILRCAAPVNGGERPPIEYRYEGGTHWCPLGPAERMKPDFKGVYRLMAGKYPVWQGDDVNGGERELGQVIDERDQYHDAAEKLADAIAKHFGVEIGEHSNLNCPWQNALDHIAQATKRAADAQQVGAARYEKVDGCKDCRHAHYYSADRWECLKANRMFDELGRPVAAPAWCPLPALTSPAKAGGDEREAFEAWARGAYDCDGDADDGSNVLRRNGPDYVYSGVSDAWAGWQARAAPTSPAKVGGDEWERFVRWYTRGTGKPISTNDRDAETAWDAWRAALSADGGQKKVTRSRVLPGEQLLTFPLPEGGKVTLTWPEGISSASIATLSEMLVASALHYLAAEEAFVGPKAIAAKQARRGE